MARIITIHVGFGSNAPDYSSASSHYHELHRRILLDLLRDRFSGGFTLLEGVGYFQGEAEPCANAVVIIPDYVGLEEQARIMREAYNVARAYKEKADQAQVWVTSRDEVLTIFD